ncbi:MAG: VWA domain-containing protein [Dehalococcoidia bacterium]|nr:VWA domain-containing protein [Dehalococcoidia bacterium]
MTLSADLTAQYASELRGFGASLPDDFARGIEGVSPSLDEVQLERWARAGVELANSSLRSWEAAAEYFRASPAVARELTFDQLLQWVDLATELSGRSSLMSAAFLKGTPEALDHLGSDDLDAWSRQGDRLCRGNWKSIALSALYFQVSPRLLESLPLDSIGRLVDIVDQLTERSYELATTCLESAPPIFAALAPADRAPFLAFARAVTRASWADTRLYFERGPRLLESIAPGQRAAFLDLASRVTMSVGRQGFPLFADSAQAIADMPEDDHEALIAFASRLAPGSPAAAMEFLKSAPFIRSRLTPEQMEQWTEVGVDILVNEHNAEGAEAYFRLESTRAEDTLRALSARIELTSINTMLRMYAKALSGEQVSVQSTENLVDRNIGWVTESTATTEGTAIYLPPFVNTFPEQQANFQVYKVFTTHQTGRMEFGSFGYRFAEGGAHTPVTVTEREVRRREAKALEAAQQASDGRNGGSERDAADVATAMQRYFNCFADRTLIGGLFTVVEDTRVDACVAQEYGGIRRWLKRLQEYEADQRPAVHTMALRQAFVENLLRASLGRPDTIRWPASLNSFLEQGLGALKVVEQRGASVQDSAEVAASLYDLAVSIPNVVHNLPEEDWVAPAEDMISVAPSMPGGGEGEPQMMPNGEDLAFENPQQPEFRGDFKPELVQLLMKLKLQQDGKQQDGVNAPLTKEQLMELLENSAEITISEWAEGDLASSLGMFLSNLEKDAGTPAGEKQQGEGQDDQSSGTDGGTDEEELPMRIDYFYYDEWDFRAGDYRPRWTRVGERLSEEGDDDYYDETLRKNHGLVMETRRQFELMRPESFRKIRRLEDGHDIDLDQAIEFIVDKRAGVGPQARFYSRRNKIERDVAVAFLLDMSASTDEEIEKQRQKYDKDDDGDDFDGDPRKYFQWLAQRRAKQALEPPKRIIDLEKESAVLVVEALEAIGDSYGIFGFSGYGRDNVEFHVIKDLTEEYGPRVRKRIAKIEPIRSTRMGPAIRHTIHKLDEYDAKVKILILVSDGRPQDHGYGRDRTEKEYAVHDTKQALNEAKRNGITPFLITVDKEGHDYLKQMCDDIGYEVVDNIESLPRRLPTLYRHLAAE